MQTLEHAAALLLGATSLDNVADIFVALGFVAPLLTLDDDAISALQLPQEIVAARICRGDGALRGLALELSADADSRETLRRVATSLDRNAPSFLWLVVAVKPLAKDLTLLSWRTAANRVRIASLVCSRGRVAQSDAETLCTLVAAREDSDLLTHARWLDVLGREAITNRFFRALHHCVTELADSLGRDVKAIERRELALLYISRLIFLAFLETKGWLDADFSFLANGYSGCMENGGRYQKRVLEPLFFGTLNTRVSSRSPRARNFGRVPFLNGGLFSRSRLEKRTRGSAFSDESFGNAFALVFNHYRFTGQEDTADWTDCSIDPEILGKTFEALMAAEDRKRSGSFYTPQDLVERLTASALDSVLNASESSETRLDGLRRLRILDPACGSGAFLVHALERLASLRQRDGEPGSIAAIRRRVLAGSIFGVDLNPMAVWLCELRLWLAVVVESDETDPMRIEPLPNLDRNIRVGESLAGGAFDERSNAATARKLFIARNRYVRATGLRKLSLSRVLDKYERSAAIDALARRRQSLTSERREILLMLRGRDLFGARGQPDQTTRVRLSAIRRSLRDACARMKALRAGAALPFSFNAQFSDIAAAGGFDIVLGNPPWVRVHRIPEQSRLRLKQEFTVYRRAAWQAGADGAGTGHGFAAQIDLSALFVERGVDLLRPGGTLAYLLPGKLWRSLAGGGVREFLLERAKILLIEDISETRSQFDAAVYPSLLVARRRVHETASPGDSSEHMTVRVISTRGTRTWRSSPQHLSMDATKGSPWLLLPKQVRRAFNDVSHAAVPMGATTFGRPLLGVKTGHNDAYLVQLDSCAGDVARVRAGDRTADIERAVLRPVIRGETISPWKLTAAKDYIVWTQGDDGRPRTDLPPLTRRWLAPYRDALLKRTDLRDHRRWWSLFRVEAASWDKTRVVWADFGLRPRATVLPEGERYVPLNTAYVARCDTVDDGLALATILNSSLATAWLNVVAEPARGGYRRYLGWTISLLPLPKDWSRARGALAPLGASAMEGCPPSEAELLEATLNAYDLQHDRVEPLLSWSDTWD